MQKFLRYIYVTFTNSVFITSFSNNWLCPTSSICAGTERCDRKYSKKFMHKTHTDEGLKFFIQRTWTRIRKFFMPWTWTRHCWTRTWTRIKNTFTQLWDVPKTKKPINLIRIKYTLLWYGGLRFKSRVHQMQIRHSVVNGLPPLRRFFKAVLSRR